MSLDYVRANATATFIPPAALLQTVGYQPPAGLLAQQSLAAGAAPEGLLAEGALAEGALAEGALATTATVETATTAATLAEAAAALTAVEVGGGAEVEAATGPVGWIVGGVIVLTIGGLLVAAWLLSDSKPKPQAQPNVEPRAEPEAKEEKKPTCATEYPSLRRCDSLPAGYIYSSPQAALNALKIRLGDKNLSLRSPAPTTSGPCPGVGTHYNVRSGGAYVASIVCCPCCTDTPEGPVTMTRCAIV
jgi:hypothetical protein